MAGYRGHLTFSTALGAAYGGAAAWQWQLDWGPAALAAGVTAVGGLLPDLDSGSGLPLRELSGLAGVAAACLLLRRLQAAGLSADQVLVVLAGSYLFMRYAVAEVFKRVTVHRGMFHSVPAMLVAGLAVFLIYHHPDPYRRLLLGGGVMLGFLSHLALDELCSVDFSGGRVRLHKSAGSALKFYSPSAVATLATYALLAGLVWLAGRELEAAGLSWPALREQFWKLVAGGPG